MHARSGDRSQYCHAIDGGLDHTQRYAWLAQDLALQRRGGDLLFCFEWFESDYWHQPDERHGDLPFGRDTHVDWFDLFPSVTAHNRQLQQVAWADARGIEAGTGHASQVEMMGRRC